MHKLDRQEMLKTYAEKKVSQIVETTVDFLSAASTIYHCFLSGSASGDVRC